MFNNNTYTNTHSVRTAKEEDDLLFNSFNYTK